jgi:hypothetical protein
MYTLYSQSPKNGPELDIIAKELGVELRKIRRVLGVLWAASSFKTVRAVDGYNALAGHFLENKAKANCNGLCRRLASFSFVNDPGTMLRCFGGNCKSVT